MAQIGVTQLHDGPRNAVYHVSIIGTGAGDLEDVTIIDPAAFEPPLSAKPTLRLEEIWYDLAGFSAWLEFDYLTEDTPVWSMSAGNPTYLCFQSIGGLADRSVELDGAGILKLSTDGLGADDRGTIIVKARKH